MQEVVEEGCAPHRLRRKDSTLTIMRHLCAVHGDFHFLIALQKETGKVQSPQGKILYFQINGRKSATSPDRRNDAINPFLKALTWRKLVEMISQFISWIQTTSSYSPVSFQNTLLMQTKVSVSEGQKLREEIVNTSNSFKSKRTSQLKELKEQDH